MRRIIIVCLLALLALSSCYREPELHLYDQSGPVIEFPFIDLSLDIYWNYMNYDWKAEWYYGKHGEEGGWDDEDHRLFGELEYVEPTHFFLRRYYTGSDSCGTRLLKKPAEITGRSFRASYDWGWWDILAWNDVKTLDGIQSLIFDESELLDDPITAYTNPTMYSTRYHAPRFQNSFYEPEQLFSACKCGVEVNKDLKDFILEKETNTWVRKLEILLEPRTFIYLPQIIVRNNPDTITGIDRIISASVTSNLSGMARSTNINTGFAGSDAVAVNYKLRMKQDMDYKNGEKVDIIGGRLMTFGICGQNANRIESVDQVKDPESHYIDVNFQFSNGMDSTIVFNVTDQVRQRWRVVSLLWNST